MAEIKNRIEGQFDDATRRGQTGSESGVLETVKEKAQDVAAGAAALAGRAKDTAQEWAEAAGDVACQAGGTVQEWAGAAYDTAGDWGQDLTRLVRRHPLPSLLIGFGLGFLLAQVTRRS